MEKNYKVLAVNPGSTSTKVGYFLNNDCQWKKTIQHTEEELKNYTTIQSQLPYRVELVEELCKEQGVDLAKDVDIFVGRGGGMVSVLGGVYEINDALIHDCEVAKCGAHHPAQLASQMCRILIDKYGGWGCTCNPPDTDELVDVARPTGLKEIFRKSSYHALNQKEIAFRYAESIGKKYSDLNLIIVHIGGGTSISAHRKGLTIDTTDILTGDGPMTPTRAGQISTTKIVDMAFSGEYTRESLRKRLVNKGGLIDHLGTDNAVEIEKMIEGGDRYAKVIYDSMLYQISKYVGYMAVALQGKVDQIILTGGMANSKYVTSHISEYTQWIAPVSVLAGEFELEALVAGALRAKKGEVPVLTYTGEPMFKNFDHLKNK